jgi:hypothetical protein
MVSEVSPCCDVCPACQHAEQEVMALCSSPDGDHRGRRFLSTEKWFITQMSGPTLESLLRGTQHNQMQPTGERFNARVTAQRDTTQSNAAHRWAVQRSSHWLEEHSTIKRIPHMSGSVLESLVRGTQHNQTHPSHSTFHRVPYTETPGRSLELGLTTFTDVSAHNSADY